MQCVWGGSEFVLSLAEVKKDIILIRQDIMNRDLERIFYHLQITSYSLVKKLKDVNKN